MTVAVLRFDSGSGVCARAGLSAVAASRCGDALVANSTPPPTFPGLNPISRSLAPTSGRR